MSLTKELERLSVKEILISDIKSTPPGGYYTADRKTVQQLWPKTQTQSSDELFLAEADLGPEFKAILDYNPGIIVFTHDQVQD